MASVGRGSVGEGSVNMEYLLVNVYIAIENDHRNSEFSCGKRYVDITNCKDPAWTILLHGKTHEISTGPWLTKRYVL